MSSTETSAAQRPVPPADEAPSTPTFRTGTKLVEVDVIAKSKGAPASGLTVDDFTLFDNGQARRISFFVVRSGSPATGSVPGIAALPTGAVSNRLERDGDSLASTTILLVDQKNTPPVNQAFAIQRIVDFVQKRRANERVGIYTFGKNHVLRAVQDITTDTDLLTRAARSLKAQDTSYRDLDTAGMSDRAADGLTALELMERGMDTKHALQAIARHVAGLPGRKTIVWITTGFPIEVQALGIDFRPDLEQAARELNDARVSLYAVDARGLQSALSGLTAIPAAESAGPQSQLQVSMQVRRSAAAKPPGLDTMNKLAGLTGGLVYYDKSNAIEESIRRAIDDGDLTYTLGFYPAGEDQDGTLHKVKVEVRKRGISVRYRDNYFASKTAAAEDRPTLAQLLNDSLDAAQLEMLAQPLPDNARRGMWNIRVNVDLHHVQLEQANERRSGAIDVSFLNVETGALQTRTFKIDIPDDRFAAFLEQGIDAMGSIDTGGKDATVRVVVQDRATGAAGSVRLRLAQ